MADHTIETQIKNLGSPDRVWTIPSIHGDLNRLISIHDQILEKFTVGDRLVYLGNYTGYGEQSAACVEEILTFRRLILSLPGMKCDDITYLRGAQEEMWQKLLELPFSAQPTDTFLWMLGNGLSGTLRSYGLSEHDGIEACRSGIMFLTKWVAKVRVAVRARAGHETFSTAFVRAVHTDTDHDYPILFVNSGVDANCPLERQGDKFWWSGSQFSTIKDPYLPFQKVVRGYDPAHKGLYMNCVTATVDDGCGFGGNLVSAAFNADGSVETILEA